LQEDKADGNLIGKFLKEEPMNKTVRTSIFAGVAAGLLGISPAQGAKADTIYRTTTTTTYSAPVTTYTSPLCVERTVTSPVLIEQPTMIEREIQSPVLLEDRPMVIEQWNGNHLIRIHAGPLFTFSAL
jgi:hypothetical protein